MTTVRSALPGRTSTHHTSGSAATITPPLQGMIVAAGPLFGATYAANAGLAPTGHAVADLVWSAIFGGLLAFVASRAHVAAWLACSALTVIAADMVAIAAGYLLASIGLWSAYHFRAFAIQRLDGPPVLVRTVAGASSAPLLLGLHDLGYPGVSAAIAGTAFGIFLVVAAQGTKRRTKRIMLPAAVIGLLGVVVLAFFAFTFLTSLETSVRNAEASAHSTVSSLRQGEFDEAFDALADVDVSLSLTAEHFSRPMARVLRVLPISGHNIDALDRLISASHDLVQSGVATGSPSERAGSVLTNGDIDPVQLARLQTDLRNVSVSLERMQFAIDQQTSIWLAPQIDRALEDVSSQLGPAFEQTTELHAVIDALPSLLGIESPRRYLVLLGNPAEARELGGFTGATALLELNGGSFEIQTVGRRAGEQTRASAAALPEPPPVRFLEHRPWLFEQNYSAMADFPTLSRALSGIFPANGGAEIDGAIYLDPFALEALVEATGPIDIPSLGGAVRAEDIANLLLVDQYERFLPGAERDAFFDDLLSGVANAIRSGDFDLNARSGRSILAAIEQDRLLFAPLDPVDLAAADILGTTGRITPLSSNDYLAVSHLNSGANKLDTYLLRDVEYSVVRDENDAGLAASVEVRLSNDAPEELPAYAAGRVALQPGTSRTTLVIHSPHEFVSWEGITDEIELARSFREFDRWRHEAVVIIPRGETRTVRLNLEGTLEGDDYALDIGHQPLVTDDVFSIVADVGGREFRDRFVLTEDTSVAFPPQR